MGHKNSGSDTKKINGSSNSKQLKVWYSHASLVCYFILRNLFSIIYQISFLVTSILTQEIIVCELKTEDSNLLAIACVCRSPNSTISNSDNLNVLLKNIYDKYNANLIVLGDFNYPGIDWVHCSTNSCISDSNYKFLETTRDCFFPTKCEKFNNKGQKFR